MSRVNRGLGKWEVGQVTEKEGRGQGPGVGDILAGCKQWLDSSSGPPMALWFNSPTP